MKRTFAYHFDDISWTDNSRLQEPRKAEANENVEHITSDGVWRGHVTVT